MKTTFPVTGLCLFLLTSCFSSNSQANKDLQISKLFMELPYNCPTPDGMAIAPI